MIAEEHKLKKKMHLGAYCGNNIQVKKYFRWMRQPCLLQAKCEYFFTVKVRDYVAIILRVMLIAL